MKNDKDYTIAIFDSGIGGISILRQLIRKYKAGKYIYFADNLFMPYGNKDREFVKGRVNEIIDYLRQEHKADKIIIACNTASSCLNGNKDKDLELLSFDKDKQYLTTELTQKNLKGYNIISSKNLASEIEANIFNKRKLNKIIKQAVSNLNLQDLENLILGCTHYELVADIFKKYCKNTKIELNSTYLINKLNFNPKAELEVKIIMSNKTKEYQYKLIKLLKMNKY